MRNAAPSSRLTLALVATLVAASPRAARAIPADLPLSQLTDRLLADRGAREVMTIAQTPDGYLWFGGGEGLSRFDGVRTRRVSTDERGGQIPSGTVVHLRVARDGSLYVGTDSGLAIVTRDRIEAIAALAGETVRASYEASDGGLYVGTSRGLWYRAPRSKDYARVESVGAAHVCALASDGPEPGDTLLVGLTEGGLLRLAARRVTARFATTAPGVPRSVNAILRTQRGAVLLGTNAGIELFEGEVVRPLAGTGASTLAIHALVEDRDGTVWAAADTQGLHRLAGDRLVSDCGAWCEASPFSLFEAATGELLVGTMNAGVHVLRSSEVWSVGKPEGVPADPVLGSLIVDGQLWLGLVGHGTWRAEMVHGATLDRGRPVLAADGSPLPALRDGLRAPWGAMLIATEHGAMRVTKDGVGAPIEAIGNVRVMKLIVNGSRVLAATGNGLYQIEERAAQAVAAFRGVVIRDLARGPKNTVWVSTANRGLARLESEKITWYTKDDLLHSNDIGALWVHGDDIWFVEYGGDPATIVRLSGTAVSRLGGAEGIPGVVFRQIMDDGHDMVWGCADDVIVGMPIAELDGVIRDPRQKVHALAIDGGGGLRAGCTELGNAPRRDEEGRIWFNTARGLAGVDSKTPHPTVPAPEPIIEELIVDSARVPMLGAATLAAGSHRVELRYTGVTLWRPNAVSFRYRLEGVDQDWQYGDESRTAVYTDLPPGPRRLTIEAAYDFLAGGAAKRTLEIYVTPRFYQRTSVRIAFALLIGALIWSGFRMRVRALERRGRWLTAEVAARTRDLEETRDELMRAERLASVATLVRGIAHELNNPLGVLQNNLVPLHRYTTFLSQSAASLKQHFSGSAEELERIEKFSPKKDLDFVVRDLDQITTDMAHAATRAQRIIGDLQGLGGSATRPFELVAVDRVIADMLRIFAPRVPEGVELTSEVPAGITARLRAGELEQVIINLVDNALHAVNGKGHIRVRASVIEGGFELSVSDDGVGMTPEVVQRATQAFFTTRAPSEGSGLGLAVVSSIAGREAEALHITSAPGAGTTVRVRMRSTPEEK